MGIRPFSRQSTRRIIIFSWSRSRSRSQTTIAFRNSDPTREASAVDPHNATILALAQANRQAMGMVAEDVGEGPELESRDSGHGSSLMLSARGSSENDSWYTATGESLISTPPPRSPSSSAASHVSRAPSPLSNTLTHPLHFPLPTTATYNDNFEDEYASLTFKLRSVHSMAEFEELTRRRAMLLQQQSVAELAMIGTGGVFPSVRASEIAFRIEAERMRQSLWGTNNSMSILTRSSPIPVMQYTAVAATQMWECCACGFLAMPVGRDVECLGEECAHEQCGDCWVFRPTWEERRRNRFEGRRRERKGEWWTGGRRGPPRSVEAAGEERVEDELVQEEKAVLAATDIGEQAQVQPPNIGAASFNDLYDISPPDSPILEPLRPVSEEDISVSA